MQGAIQRRRNCGTAISMSFVFLRLISCDVLAAQSLVNDNYSDGSANDQGSAVHNSVTNDGGPHTWLGTWMRPGPASPTLSPQS